jgi:hypothetical protein
MTYLIVLINIYFVYQNVLSIPHENETQLKLIIKKFVKLGLAGLILGFFIFFTCIISFIFKTIITIQNLCKSP